MKKTAIHLFFILSIVFGVSGQVNAIPIVGTFSGEIDFVSGIFESSSEIGIGTQFEGTFSYDSSSPAVYNDYFYDGSSLSMALTLLSATDNYTLESSNWGCGAIVKTGELGFLYIDFLGSIQGYHPDEAHISLMNNGGNVFEDTSLPTGVDIDGFTDGTFWICNYGDSVNYFELRGQIETFSAQPVPEPSTALMLGGGLLGLAAYSRKRRKK